MHLDPPAGSGGRAVQLLAREGDEERVLQFSGVSQVTLPPASEPMCHIYNSRGQIMACASRKKSWTPFELSAPRSEARVVVLGQGVRQVRACFGGSGLGLGFERV